MGSITVKNATTVAGDTQDIHIDDGVIVAIGNPGDDFAADTVIDASGKLTSTGLIDTWARLREPGLEKKATIASEARAAALGGITTVMCSPATEPVIDEAATVELINRKARDAGHAKILPYAAATRGLEGEQLSELATLTQAGCVAATNADQPITDTQVIRSVMEYARTFNTVLAFAPVDAWLTANGCAHEGATATRLGLPSVPVAAETVALSMLIELAWQTGARIHFSRVTSRRGADMIRDAKRDGLKISADTSIQHLYFEESCLASFDSQYRSASPFRSLDDREGLREAVGDGTIDVICSDHAPHERDAKLAPFQSAEPGISSFDTFLSQLIGLESEADIPLATLLDAATKKPAVVFGLDQGYLEVGKPADIIVIDVEQEYTLQGEEMNSKGKNTPLLGKTLKGKVTDCLIAGKLIKTV